MKKLMLLAALLAMLAVVVAGGLFALLVNVNLILAIVAAVVVVGTAIALITAFSSYVTTAYHTCLYIWARDVERATLRQEQGIPVNVPAPAPLAAVLGTI